MDIFSIQGFWWIIAGIFLFLEIITPATIFIFPSIAALFVALLGLFMNNFVIQIVIFIILNIVFIILIRPLFVTGKNNKGYKQGIDSLLNQQVRVVESIDNSKELGRIKHGADLFPAKSFNGNEIPEGTWVKIVKIKGITAFVEEIKK